MDPFAVLGLAPTMDVATEDLEQRYLELSRASHPDHHGGGSPEQQLGVLARSAQLNDAYRVVKDPWRRAAALLELRDPGVSERTKRLSADFLADAMELSEEVASAGQDQVPELRARITRAVAADLGAIRSEIAAGRFAAAATRLHQSRYHRKALADLAGTSDGAS